MKRKQHSTRRNRRNAKANRHGRVVGLGTAAGTFLTAAMAPMVAAPPARAGVLDTIIDPIIQPVIGAVSTAALEGINAGTAALEGINAGTAAALSGLSAGTAAFEGIHTAALESITNSLNMSAAAFNAGGLSAATPASNVTLNNLVYNAFDNFYTAVYTAGQGWIASPAGEQVDGVINAPFLALFGRDLIGNGVNDYTGPNTGLIGQFGMNGNVSDGGFLFGNGGAGAAGTASHPAGFGGGGAGLIGNGGKGGNGVYSSSGYVAVMAGGHGGAGGVLMGNGGAGGVGGYDSTGIGGLGGAGGNAGVLFGNGGAGGVGGGGFARNGQGGYGGNAAWLVGNGGVGATSAPYGNNTPNAGGAGGFSGLLAGNGGNGGAAFGSYSPPVSFGGAGGAAGILGQNGVAGMNS